MDKKHYIKALEAMPGNPQIVINVLCSNGSAESWGIDHHSFKLVDKGLNLALFTVRAKEPLLRRLARKVQAPSIQSINCTVEECLKRWLEKFEIGLDVTTVDWSNYDVHDLILSTLHKEIAELVKLNEDFIRAMNVPELKSKWSLENEGN